ncbi:DAK2 domain-containing protein [Paenarthrobacter sp. DKR-5]|uniref:DAK2 domain-containing protein n=1 Tax=Paenarthrobacter sp. DKR-5 TaxID=2835535 RepID=UPI0027DDE04F|nr:DAK2 domain-containing protein [Paenarthrobacter sp. DKR-5]
MQSKVAANAEAMRQWLGNAEKLLGNHSEQLNAINIFPVADGDTGSNLYFTVKAAADAAAALKTEDIGELFGTAAGTAMENARGNSGTLFSVILAAMAEPLRGAVRLTGPSLAAALESARIRSWSALSDPVAGTMLSVLEETSRAALDADASRTGDESSSGLVTMIESMIDAARAAVVDTESQLAPLEQARVVDAGAVGFLLLLDALRATLVHEQTLGAVVRGLHGLGFEQPHASRFPAKTGVEIMCTINLEPLDAANLRLQLDELGNSVILSPVSEVSDGAGGYRWRVHVHVPEPEPALALLKAAGEPENLSLTDLAGEPAVHGQAADGTF